MKGLQVDGGPWYRTLNPLPWKHDSDAASKGVGVEASARASSGGRPPALGVLQ